MGINAWHYNFRNDCCNTWWQKDLYLRFISSSHVCNCVSFVFISSMLRLFANKVFVPFMVMWSMLSFFLSSIKNGKAKFLIFWFFRNSDEFALCRYLLSDIDKAFENKVYYNIDPKVHYKKFEFVVADKRDNRHLTVLNRVSHFIYV